MKSFLSLIFLPLSLASQLKLYHRVFHPTFSTPYAQRGSISISTDDVAFHSLSSFSEDLLHFSVLLQSVDGLNATLPLYQIALEHEGDTSEAQWDFSSVKLCHLPQSTSQTIHLYLSDQGKPYAIDYFVSPIPHDGSCPKITRPKSSNSQASLLQEFAKNVQKLNTTLQTRRPSSPPLPELKTPPPLTPEGDVVKPIPEKSFIQKYWMYIAIGLVAITLSGGSEEEPGPRRPA